MGVLISIVVGRRLDVLVVCCRFRFKLGPQLLDQPLGERGLPLLPAAAVKFFPELTHDPLFPAATSVVPFPAFHTDLRTIVTLVGIRIHWLFSYFNAVFPATSRVVRLSRRPMCKGNRQPRILPMKSSLQGDICGPQPKVTERLVNQSRVKNELKVRFSFDYLRA